MRLAFSPKRIALQMGLALAVSLALLHPAQAADSGWLTGSPAFPNTNNVSVVAAHPYNSNLLAAVVDNVLQYSLNGGANWTASSLTAVTAISYDPVYPGVVYAGTTTGMRKSLDNGATWSSFGSGSSLAYSVTSAALDKNFIYSLEYDGVNTQVYKFSRSGTTTQISFPTGTPSGIAVDSQSGAVYVGSTFNLYRSADYGANWSVIHSDSAIGSIRKIVSRQSVIWMLGTQGLWRSTNTGSSFSRLMTGTGLGGTTINTDFNSGNNIDPRNLLINHNTAYIAYKRLSPNNFTVIEVTSAGVQTDLATVALSGPLFAVPGDMAGSGETLWLAGDNSSGQAFGTGGLWKRTGRITGEAAIARPIVVVPGIMGSWPVNGTWTFDPITHSYDSLLGMLRNAGYVDNTTLFTWGYDWRQSYATTADALAAKLVAVRAACSCSAVDVVAYDTGGLVARSYVDGGGYNGDIANLVLLATPNAGSVEAYSLYQGGISTSADPMWRLARWVLGAEAAESHMSLGAYIQANVPMIGQTLPIFSYLDGLTYPTGYVSNSFLTTLNSGANLVVQNSRTRVINVGSNGLATTLSSLAADLSSTQRSGTGDGSVLFSSMASIANPDLVLSSSHIGSIRRPSADWLAQLLGGPVSVTVPSVSDTNLLAMYVKSPVKLSITDPAAKQINDVLNQISGAFYTGSGANAQFMVIPNFTGGIYQTVLDGVGAGAYTVGVAQIMTNFGSDVAAEYPGTVINGQQDQLTYNSATNSWMLVSQTGLPAPSNGGNNVVVPPDQPLPSAKPTISAKPAVAAPAQNTIALVDTPHASTPSLVPPTPEVPVSEASPVWWGMLLIVILLMMWSYVRGRRHQRNRLRL